MLSAIYRLAAPTAISSAPADYQTPLAYMMLMNPLSITDRCCGFTLKAAKLRGHRWRSSPVTSASTWASRARHGTKLRPIAIPSSVTAIVATANLR